VALQVAAAQADVDEATMEIRRLEGDLAEARRSVVGLGPAREQYLAILQQIETAEQELRQSKDRLASAEAALQAAEAARDAGRPAFRPAEPPAVPAWPRLWQVLAVTVGATLVAGVVAAGLAEWSQRGVATAEAAAARFDVPVLGTIPEIVSGPRRLARWCGRWLLRPVLWLAVAAGVAMAAGHVVLWLRYPEAYEQWKQHPPAYVAERLAEWSDAARPPDR
jgi:hypothetical protein